MPVEGAIAERVRGILPVTWDALLNDRRHGDALLRTAIDTQKELTFGSVVLPELETTYALIVIDYVAKLAAIDLIPSAIDFWLSQPIAVATTGTEEQVSYSERASALRDLRRELLAEVRRLQPIVEPLIPYRRVIGGPRPRMNTIDDVLLTPSPQEFPRPFRITDRS